MTEAVDIEQMLAAALANHESGHVELAEAGYREVSRQAPADPDALNLLGVMPRERGEFGPAITLLTRAIEAEPAFSEALSNLSRALRLSRDPDAAVEMARRAIAQDAAMAEAHLNLGRALIDLGNDGGGAVALRQAAALAPESVEILTQLANLLSRLDDKPAAANALAAILALEPERVDVMIWYGAVLTALDRFDEALTWHDRAVARTPDNPAAHAALAITLRHRKDIAGAIIACRRSLELAPEQVEVWLDLAANHAAAGGFADAGACCREALGLRPNAAAPRGLPAAIGRQSADAVEVDRLRAVLLDSTAARAARIAAGMSAGTRCTVVP